MPGIKRNDVLETSETLANKGDYEQALTILEAKDCVMASWLKGKIYYSAAEELSLTFAYKYYPTSDMKARYLKLLNEAYNYFYSTALSLHNAGSEIREYLHPLLWRQIAVVENELAKNNYLDQKSDPNENYCDFITPQHLDYVIEQITDMDL